MSAGTRLVIFGGLLVALFGGGALAGGAVDIDRSGPRADAAGHGGGEPPEHGGGEAAAHPVRGVAVAENGLRLAIDDPELRRGHAQTVRFRVVEASGETVRAFDVEHTKRMHVIVARRDLTGFQHLHPQQGPDGSWSLPLKLDEAGSYRLFADFSHDDVTTTLASDLRVDGTADLRPLPAPAPTAISDGGYDVRLDAGRAKPGEEADLRFTVSKHGRPVRSEPYLGAGGHLVALREGDLAFLHVHPTEGEHAEAEGESAQSEGIGFAATFPTRGRYRLFLQFKHEGAIQTVAFTQEVS